MKLVKIITISGLIGVVIGLTGSLFYAGIKLQSTNPAFSYFILSAVFTVIVLGIDLYFGKRTDNKLDEIKGIVKGIERKIDGLSEKNNEMPVSIEVIKQEDHKNEESFTVQKKCWFKAKGYQ